MEQYLTDRPHKIQRVIVQQSKGNHALIVSEPHRRRVQWARDVRPNLTSCLTSQEIRRAIADFDRLTRLNGGN